MSYKYALALFNSELFFYWLFHMGKRKGKQLQVDQAQISELPMYIASERKQRENSVMIENIQKELLSGNSIDELEEQLNATIYQLYNLNSDEIAKVKAFVKKQREL